MLLGCMISTRPDPWALNQACVGGATLQEAARAIAAVSRQAGLDVQDDDYIGRFQPVLMDVIYQWSKGASFAQVWLGEWAVLPWAGQGGRGAGCQQR
jgi:superfamily II RNA helicase